MCDTSTKSCDQGLYFVYLHLRPLSKLWGRYDPKTGKSSLFACNCVISSHRIMCNASIERSHRGFHFFFLLRQALSNIGGRYDQKTIKIR